MVPALEIMNRFIDTFQQFLVEVLNMSQQFNVSSATRWEWDAMELVNRILAEVCL